MTETLDLAALIGSRICHDLISPIGAIGNGVELMLMDRRSIPPELALIAESAASANAKISFFRIAFGFSSPGQRVSAKDIQSTLAALGQGGKIRFHWRSPTDLDRAAVRLAFLLIQCAESAMPWGGDMTIEESHGSWSLIGEAGRVKYDPEIWAGFSREEGQAPTTPSEMSAAKVHFLLAQSDLYRRGLILSHQFETERLKLTWGARTSEAKTAS